MFRSLFRLAVIVSLFTIASLANSALSWHLPLPDLIPNTEPAPQCVLPGTTPQTTPPGAATSAYGNPAAAAQPAGFGAVIPDLPSAMGKVQGQLLHKLDGPPPTQAQLQGFARAVGSGAARWFTSLQAAMKGQDAPASVTAYQDTQRAAFLAQNTTSCNPCQPHADGSPRPYNQAGYTTAGSPGEQVARRAAVAAGFTGIHIEEAVEVARAETGGTFKATAANPRSSARGVWQIMLSAHQDDPDITRWADPMASARMAYRISSGGTNWSPWTTWPTARKHVHAGTGQATAQNVAGGMECAVYPTAAKGAGPGPWGGYSNGRIPASALAHPVTAPRALFRPDAAAAFDRLNAAYRARFGVGITVTDSYRDLATQVRTKARKKGLAAEPGTSNHGWGLAADLGGGIQTFGSPQKQWMDANAPRFGWVNPSWARQGGSKPESWHHEYVGATRPGGPSA
jgi:hypothetical protein